MSEETPIQEDSFLSKYAVNQGHLRKSVTSQGPIHIPVEKPPKTEFIRTNPDLSGEFKMIVMEGQGMFRSKTYLLLNPSNQSLLDELADDIVLIELQVYKTRSGVLGIWPLKLPDGNRGLDSWNLSAHEIAEVANSEWLRVRSDESSGRYAYTVAKGTLPDPKWPPLSFGEILTIAFDGKTIEDETDDRVRLLLGDI